MKITALWSCLASYTVAFFRELVASENCRLQLIYQKPNPSAPYDRFDLSFCDLSMEDSTQNRTKLEEMVHGFAPNCILMCSWAFPHFMRLAREMRRRGVYVVAAIDNQWRGTLKQHVGVLSSSWFLKSTIDTFLVAGDRQAYFARKLGFEDVLHGYYAADTSQFSTTVPVPLRRPSFLFVGRLDPEKNIRQLVRAYNLYRQQDHDPWPLVVAGAGPLASLLSGVRGVEVLGFVQPCELARVMKKARCLIMPSVFEPWGVAIHEGAAAGLPIIATYECGATTAFLRDGVNGFIVSPRAESIAAAMVRLARSSEEELVAMSQASSALAGLWTPRRLAGYFHAMLTERIAEKEALRKGA